MFEGASGKRIATLKSPSAVQGLAASHDSTLIAGIGPDQRSVLLWRALGPEPALVTKQAEKVVGGNYGLRRVR